MLLGTIAMVSLTMVAGAGVPNASAQARPAGLSAEQARALQTRVDTYLVKLEGRGKQVSPNRIDLAGATLTVRVPGEDRPRELPTYGGDVCDYQGAPRDTFCAYEFEGFLGDSITMYYCATYGIPWYTTGSWINNQTPGTQPLATFGNGDRWSMPPAYSEQFLDVDWSPVLSITNC